MAGESCGPRSSGAILLSIRSPLAGAQHTRPMTWAERRGAGGMGGCASGGEGRQPDGRETEGMCAPFAGPAVTQAVQQSWAQLARGPQRHKTRRGRSQACPRVAPRARNRSSRRAPEGSGHGLRWAGSALAVARGVLKFGRHQSWVKKVSRGGELARVQLKGLLAWGTHGRSPAARLGLYRLGVFVVVAPRAKCAG
jgi:hypothetical protein